MNLNRINFRRKVHVLNWSCEVFEDQAVATKSNILSTFAHIESDVSLLELASLRHPGAAGEGARVALGDVLDEEAVTLDNVLATCANKKMGIEMLDARCAHNFH